MKYLGLWSPGLRKFFWKIYKTLRPPSYILNIRSLNKVQSLSLPWYLYPFFIRKGNRKNCNFKKACRNTAFYTKNVNEYNSRHRQILPIYLKTPLINPFRPMFLPIPLVCRGFRKETLGWNGLSQCKSMCFISLISWLQEFQAPW